MTQAEKTILARLEENAKYTPAELAAYAGISAQEAAAIVKKLEEEHVILGYTGIIDWDRVDDSTVTALIEVSVTPQSDDGFDRIAKRVYQYDEVESMYLMSGGFDFTVIISGRTLRDVSMFVSSKLAPIPGVRGTATHFILRKYKEKHALYCVEKPEKESPIFV